MFKSLFTKDKQQIMEITRKCLIAMLVITLICVPFAILMIIRFGGDPYVPLIVAGVELLFIALAFAWINLNKRISIPFYIYVIFLAILIFIGGKFAVYTNYELAYIQTDLPLGNWQREFQLSWESWIIMGLNVVMLLTTIYLAILTAPIIEKKIKLDCATKTDFKIEKKLNKAKALFDSGIITEEEYNKAREAIINKSLVK